MSEPIAITISSILIFIMGVIVGWILKGANQGEVGI